MSKYYKAEDVINAIEDKIAEYIPVLYGRYEEIPLELRMAIESLPTIEVSEDCISRAWVKGICENMLDEEMLGHMLGYIEDAPSVVPTTEQSSMVGEWIESEIPDELYVCSECGGACWSYDWDRTIVKSYYCPNCGSKMKV